MLTATLSEGGAAMQRERLHVFHMKVSRLSNHIVENTLGLRQIPFRHVSVGDTDLYCQNTLSIPHRIRDVGGLRVCARRSLPVAVSASGSTDSNIGFDRKLRGLLRTRDLRDCLEYISGQRPTRFVVERPTVREERPAHDLVNRAPRDRLLEYGTQDATNWIANAYVFDRATDTV